MDCGLARWRQGLERAADGFRLNGLNFPRLCLLAAETCRLLMHGVEEVA
jgi:hypothetical protein